MPLTWDSQLQAFKESEIPMTYDPTIDAWRESAGYEYNHSPGAWERVWPDDQELIIFDNGNNPLGIAQNLIGSSASSTIGETIALHAYCQSTGTWYGVQCRANAPIDITDYSKFRISILKNYRSSEGNFFIGFGSDTATNTYQGLPETSTWVEWWCWGSGTPYKININDKIGVFEWDISGLEGERYFAISMSAIGGTSEAIVDKIWLEK